MYQIDLREAFLLVGDKKLPIQCESFDKKQRTFELLSQHQIRINCLASIDKKLGIAQSDYKAIFDIPLSSEHARFAYLLRAEDFR
jgi:hypothetical protein